MPRRREGTRVLGPYPYRGRWRIFLCSGGTKVARLLATEKEANAVKGALEKEIARETISVITLGQAIEGYGTYLHEVKQNKPTSCRATVWRLKRFFADESVAVTTLTAKSCARYYATLVEQVSPHTHRPLAADSHRNLLAEAKTFLAWCHQEKKWLPNNPLAAVKGHGRRQHGKPQLRIDEARAWLATAERLAQQGEAGAVAAMLTLLMGLRCSEVISRVVRDLDDRGRLLWIPASKTKAGRRTVEVPAALQPHLLALSRGKTPTELLFGEHWRDWPRHWVKRICKKSGVPLVCAHAMRGLHSTLAIAAGTTSHVVAASLGHESASTTFESYVAPGVREQAVQHQVLRRLEG